jgi:hypothetical protein
MGRRVAPSRLLGTLLAISLVTGPPLVHLGPALGQHPQPAQRAESAGPAVRAFPTRLPRVTQAAASRVIPFASNIDPARLRALKQQRSVPQAPMVIDQPRSGVPAPAPRPLIPTLQRGFNGLNNADNLAAGIGLVRPPDPDIAAGPNLRNGNSAGPADVAFNYGPAVLGWMPVVGDWNGDGVDTIGLYDPVTSTWYLRNSNSAGPADVAFSYGPAGGGWTPMIGDWNGDGLTTIGLYSGTTSTWYLRNTNAAGAADLAFNYGPPAGGWVPRTGDWDGNGTFTAGLYNETTGTFYLRNANAAGPADTAFNYGPAGAGWASGAGDWDGL